MDILALSVSAVDSVVAGIRSPQPMREEIAQTVAGILSDVRARGDEALVEITARLDWPDVTQADLRVPRDEPARAYRDLPAGLRSALMQARDNCRWFHEHERPADWDDVGPQGQKLGARYRPVRRAGLYVPGGRGSYASSVIMNVVPAQVAGVAELALCTPPGKDGSLNTSVLAAAYLLGVEEVYRVGGAQAIAAMAFGTSSVPRVDFISGPGNAYVNEAKRQVFGTVGIDSLAGPSEVLVIADETATPEWVAADLLAQEEHGSGAEAVLVGSSVEFVSEVSAALDRLRSGPASAEASSSGGVRAFYPADGEDFAGLAIAFANEYAPEHLELQVARTSDFLPYLDAAGAIFVGSYSATAFGDYVAGSNHVLPTGGAAKFASGLGVQSFLRRQSLVDLSEEAAAALTPALSLLADAEGFYFHKRSAQLRASGAQLRPMRGGSRGL